VHQQRTECGSQRAVRWSLGGREKGRRLISTDAVTDRLTKKLVGRAEEVVGREKERKSALQSQSFLPTLGKGGG